MPPPKGATSIHAPCGNRNLYEPTGARHISSDSSSNEMVLKSKVEDMQLLKTKPFTLSHRRPSGWEVHHCPECVHDKGKPQISLLVLAALTSTARLRFT